MASLVDRHPAQPPGIVQVNRQGFGFVEILDELVELTEGLEGDAQLEPKIDSLLARLATLREATQGRQRVLEVGDRLAVGRARGHLVSSRAKVDDRLVPPLAPLRKMR